MGRNLTREQLQRRAAARREGALARAELREESAPRAAASGPTSFPVKAREPGLDDMIRDFERKREGKK